MELLQTQTLPPPPSLSLSPPTATTSEDDNFGCISSRLWPLYLSWAYCVNLELGGEHRRSLPSPGWSIWNPCGIHGINVGWDHSQFVVPWTSWIPCGMIMEWSWNGHGMVNSIWNPLLFHLDSTGFHMEFRHIHHGFHGQVHMDSID